VDKLTPETTCLLLVDVQEKLAAAIPEASMARLVANARILLEAARLLRVPVIASEQYPKGLGPTIAELRDPLAAAGATPIEKLDFDACAEPAIARAVSASGARSIVVVGMEAHICVFQTARELVRRGYAAHVVADAVASRTEENRLAGLALAERAGAIPTVTETVAFDWLGRAGTDAFKAVSRLVR